MPRLLAIPSGRPSGLTPDPLDYAFPWHLLSALGAVGALPPAVVELPQGGCLRAQQVWVCVVMSCLLVACGTLIRTGLCCVQAHVPATAAEWLPATAAERLPAHPHPPLLSITP